MKQRLDRETIAARVAREFEPGFAVNLGIGIPTLAANFTPEEKGVVFHTENGALGFGPVLTQDEIDRADIDLINAGGQFITRRPGMCFFNHADSFAMIRGGHIDIAVLGALQVSGNGDLANWVSPERGVGNIGGAMDLAAGARKVIVATEHTAKNGQPKIVNTCTYPLTAKRCVDLIVTDVAVIEVTRQGLLLKEIAPGWSARDVQDLTEPTLVVASDLREIEL